MVVVMVWAVAGATDAAMINATTMILTAMAGSLFAGRQTRLLVLGCRLGVWFACASSRTARRTSTMPGSGNHRLTNRVQIVAMRRHHTTGPVRPISGVAPVAAIAPHRRSVGARLAFATVRQFYRRQLRGKLAVLLDASSKEQAQEKGRGGTPASVGHPPDDLAAAG